MPKKPKIPDAPAELRDPAGLETSKRKSKSAGLRNEVDTLKLLHELQVHRVELEVQNAELKTARDEAESLREVYTDLYDFAPLGYFTLVPDGRIQMAHLTGATLLGTDRVLLLGQAFSMSIPQDLRANFHQALKRVFEGEAEFTLDSELSVKGQPLKVVTFKFKRTRNCRECKLAVIDITARRREQDTLILSELRYRRLFETAHDGVLLLDPETRKIIDANPFMTDLLGYSQAQIVGKELFEIGLPKDEKKSQEVFTKLRKRKKSATKICL